MITTLNKILENNPCKSGWNKLLQSLNKTSADDEDLSLIYILKSNGIDDALWALRCFDYLDYCLFLADVAESVLHIYEESNDNKAPRNVILAIRDYKSGRITKDELKIAAADAADAAVAVGARKKKWNEIEELFIKHFDTRLHHSVNYFSEDELKCPHCDEYHFNSGTLARLNALRVDRGKPIIVTSGYRCKEYNILKGFTQTHASGQSVDVLCDRGEAYEILKLAFKHGFTGIGVKQKGEGRIIHLDDLTEGLRPTIWSY